MKWHCHRCREVSVSCSCQLWNRGRGVSDYGLSADRSMFQRFVHLPLDVQSNAFVCDCFPSFRYCIFRVPCEHAMAPKISFLIKKSLLSPKGCDQGGWGVGVPLWYNYDTTMIQLRYNLWYNLWKPVRKSKFCFFENKKKETYMLFF